eukprot:c20077_g1_i1 orf=718-990(-)
MQQFGFSEPVVCLQFSPRSSWVITNNRLSYESIDRADPRRHFHLVSFKQCVQQSIFPLSSISWSSIYCHRWFLQRGIHAASIRVQRERIQ